MKKIKIKNIRKSTDFTWDLEVNKYHNYYLENGLISHNSAKPSNSTSGIEPPRELATVKEDENFKTIQLVPEFSKLKNYYTCAWGDDFNNIDYFKTISLIQKFTDQSMSTNQYTNVLNFENGKVPQSLLIKEFLEAFNLGLKTLYYQNFRSTTEGDGLDTHQGCESGACSV